jgi:hypothetical protein
VEVVDIIVSVGAYVLLRKVNLDLSAPGEFRFGSMVLGFFTAIILIGTIIQIKDYRHDSCITTVGIVISVGLVAAVVVLAHSGAASWPHIGVGVLALAFLCGPKVLPEVAQPGPRHLQAPGGTTKVTIRCMMKRESVVDGSC